MSQYEVMLLTGAELEDPARGAVVDRLKNAITKGGGTMEKLDEWGRRKLAYEIEKQKEAFYQLAYVDCDGDTLREAVGLMRITDGVLRVMAVTRVPDLPEGVTLEGVTDEEMASGDRPGRGRGGRGGRGGGRDRGDRDDRGGGRDRDR